MQIAVCFFGSEDAAAEVWNERSDRLEVRAVEEAEHSESHLEEAGNARSAEVFVAHRRPNIWRREADSV